MNRHAIRTALGRVGPATTTTTIPTTTRTSRCLANGSTPTPISFFTSRAGGGGGGRDDSHSDTVKRIVQLSEQRTTNSSSSTTSESGSTTTQRSGSGPARSQRGVDARSLRVAPSAASASSAPKVLNLRSLRGRGSGLRNRLSLNARAAAAPGEAGGPGNVAFGRPGLSGARMGFGRPGGRFGGGGGAGRGDRPGFGGRGRRGGSRGRGGGFGAARRSQQDLEGKGGPSNDKVVLTPEEQAVVDRLEKGEVVPFMPKLTRESLSGYGAAVATDAALGQVETAIRTMRLMTGGMAYNPDSGVTADLTAIQRKYEAHMPFFVHSKGEKAWIESANPKLHVVGPDPATKKAIIDTTILGKYEEPKFAEISDVKGTMAAYHLRTFTYKASDSQKFMDKVLSLLPAQGGSASGAQARK